MENKKVSTNKTILTLEKISEDGQSLGSAILFHATNLSAGFDLEASSNVVIEPGTWLAVPTGLRIKDAEAGVISFNGSDLISVVPELQIRPRSGLALKHGVTVLNSPGTVDADYRGEIKVILINHGKLAFKIKAGDRIAQGLVGLSVLGTAGIKDKERGSGGFSSTGVL